MSLSCEGYWQPDGSSPIRLTYNEADDWAPAWSPDGSQIAFVSDRDGNNEIYVIDVNVLTAWLPPDSE